MINLASPDYSNTPASDKRPHFHYAPLGESIPLVSIITPYYNMGPLFQETVRSILRMSFTRWEWLLVDDGSTDQASLEQLERAKELDPRVRVIHQANSGPGVARNTAFANARGEYMFQLDCDDLIEPTFVEKAVWFLATHPEFGACGSYVVGFGAKEYTWARGFQEYERNIDENTMTNMAVIRRSAWLQMGGYDPVVSYEHADWDFWLTMAETGWWGYSLEEYLSWYRIQAKSLLIDIESDKARAKKFRTFLHTKHQALRKSFPHPVFKSNLDLPHGKIIDDIPVRNPIAKAAGSKRVLVIVPWLEMGGADKFELDLIEQLSRRGYEFTVATTLESKDHWISQFTSLTPDVFCMSRFLNAADYPRFLNYLIESRQIDAVVITQSKLGYLLAPYLRTHHPHLPIVDFSHIEVPDWNEGGYPGIAVRIARQLDLNLVCTQHLKEWMVEQGGNPEYIDVVHCNVDTKTWDLSRYDVCDERRRLDVVDDTPVLLFAGRLVDQKRPLLFMQILHALAAKGRTFRAIIAGDGPMRAQVEHQINKYGLGKRVQVIGGQNDEGMRRCMAASDILVMPSDHEGLALVLYEAMAMETVPVAARVGGQDELVTPETGVLITKQEGELEEYVRAVEALMLDPEQRRQMAAAARDRVVSQFDLSAMADAMEREFARAAEIAAARPQVTPDYDLARHTAHMAVEYMRVAQVVDKMWDDFYSPAGRVKQSLRRRLLPYSSRRYAVYKRIRFAVLAPVKALRGGKRAQAPISAASSSASVASENTPEPQQVTIP